ncbi:beta strand repeat-containing protein [Cellulomonas phragmiteti]|uniref:Gram-positive cocci surface proteins LPxTG domain-containing protein n=1 Tax=Cellulomonas phragmiteti TaxID=478780 RepID=A0ABQ4DP59_9CELL|nr:DUF11 domain-containing protein [Cellulomonas phragmiteti]GIG41141.1 hypothetical protein Cph01nite_29030 [Cellulomonas phragmiteti]
MPLFSPRSARAPRSRTTTPAARGARRSAGVALVAAAALVAPGLPAVAAPFALTYPTVFISQLVPGDSTTTMRTVVQSRLANAGRGGVTIASLGSRAAFLYNAVDYRPSDNFLYGIASNGQLVRIQHDGTATQLGTISGVTTGQYSGAFGGPNTLYVRPTGSSTSMRAVDVVARTSTAVTLSEAVTMNDFTFWQGYLWGVEVAAGSGSVPVRTLKRISTTGQVTSIDVTNLFPDADDSTGGLGTGYGAAWVYGNGNLAFSYNNTGNITQLRVTNPSATLPTATLVSTIAGPPTSQNDGATSPSTPTDLTLAVTSPAPSAPSAPITWTVQVTNSGDAGSSGATFTYPVPTGVGLTDAGLDTGCTLTSGVVQCVVGQLAPGASDTYTFTGTAPASHPVSTSSTVTVIGNEQDLTDNTATLVVAPQPQALTTTGVGTAVQQQAVTVPAGGTLTLLDGTTPVTSLSVTGVGTYAVSGANLTFTPVLGFQGEAPAAPFRVTVGSETGTGTYTATVTPPAAPAPGDLLTTGTSPASQTATVTVPPSGSVRLLDGSGDPTTTLAVAGGSYSLDTATGVITFTPAPLFVGEAPAVRFRVTDAYGRTGQARYTPTVTAPAGPSASPYTSTGVGTAVQRPATSVPIPAGGSVRLLDGGTPATSVTVDGEGTYAVDTATGELSFAPVAGFQGTATAVAYRVTDAYGQTAQSTYTATVTAPDGPVVTARTSTGVGTQPQGTTVVAPTGGAVALLGGESSTRVVVEDEGVYTLDPSTGTITFTPELGFQGAATSVTFRVTDVYGQQAQATYTPTVTPPAPPVAPDATSTGPAVTPQNLTVTLPAGGTVALSGGGSPTRVVVDGEGVYTLDPSTGTITFTPDLGFSGESQGVAVVVTDAYGQSATGSWTPTVTAPPAPQPLPATTDGVGTATQSTTVTVPGSGSVALVGGGSPIRVVVDGQGVYTLDPATGVITFAPELGFAGEADGVTYEVTDAYGQSATAVYTPTVEAPPAPAPTPLTSSGTGEEPQGPVTSVTVPAGGSVGFLDGHGDVVPTLVVGGVGTYAVTPEGVVTFTPELGFQGAAPPVTIQVTDAYGQTGTTTYTPTVTAPPAPVLGDPASSGPAEQTQAVTVPVPGGGSVALVAEDGDLVGTVTVPGQGTYVLDPSTGGIVFTPVPGYAGQTDGVTIRVTDAYGQSDDARYAPLVLAPAGPVAVDATTTGTGTTPQSTVVPVPAGTTVQLVDGTELVDRLVVAGEGTYVLDPGTHVVTFTPALGFTGEAAGATFRLTDAYGQSDDGRYTPTVLAPSAPAATDRTTSGPAGAPQSTTVAVPTGGSVTLLDADGDPVTSVTVVGQGTYVLDPATGVVTFTPAPGFSGVATPVTFRVTDAYGQTAEATSTPTVVAPAPPTATPAGTTGVGTAVQTATFPVPPGTTVALRGAGGAAATTVAVDGQGTYVLDPATGVVTFTPVLGFVGAASGVTVVLTDAYGQTASATYTPTVVLPARPTAAPLTSTGAPGTAQRPTTTVTVPSGGSVTLVDADGRDTLVVDVPGQGTYTLDPATGALTFTPVVGFSGAATPVVYRVTDAYGQSATSTYAATVAAAAAEPTPARPALAVTGTELGASLVGVALLLLAGAALVVTARRREA